MANIIDTDRLNQYDQETGTFTSSDSSSSNAWQDVAVLESGETKPSIFAKISKMFANVRFLNKRKLNYWSGGTSITISSDGTYRKGFGSSGMLLGIELYNLRKDNSSGAEISDDDLLSKILVTFTNRYMGYVYTIKNTNTFPIYIGQIYIHGYTLPHS